VLSKCKYVPEYNVNTYTNETTARKYLPSEADHQTANVHLYMAKGKQAKGGGHKRTKQPHKQSRQQQKQQQHPRTAASRRSNRLRRSTATHAFHGAKIEEYLEAHGLIRIPIVGDGNCLFRVMADQLGLGEEAHQEIRRKVVEAIRDDEAYFVNFIDSDEVDGVEAYCEEMSQNGMFL